MHSDDFSQGFRLPLSCAFARPVAHCRVGRLILERATSQSPECRTTYCILHTDGRGVARSYRDDGACLSVSTRSWRFSAQQGRKDLAFITGAVMGGPSQVQTCWLPRGEETFGSKQHHLPGELGEKKNARDREPAACSPNPEEDPNERAAFVLFFPCFIQLVTGWQGSCRRSPVKSFLRIRPCQDAGTGARLCVSRSFRRARGRPSDVLHTLPLLSHSHCT